MLADRALVEGVGRTRQFDFTVQRFVRHTQQRAVRDAQAITLGSNRAALHVHGNSTGQVDQRTLLSPAQLPVAVVIGQHGAGAQAFFQFVATLTGDLCSSLLQRQLDFSQGRNRNVRRHDPVKNAVATHIGMGQHVIADGLRLTQAATVTDHQPAVRAQNGQVVGDVFRVGGADADIDQGHAMAIVGLQVVGRHLVAMPHHARSDGLGFAVVHRLFDDHVARHYHAHKTRVIAQLLKAVKDKLVNITVIVGQQDPRLHMAPVAAGVMHQPAQGKIDPRRIEQRQRQRIGVLPIVQAISNAISGSGQVGAGEHSHQRCGRHAGAGQLITLFDDVRVRNVLLADTDFHLNGEIAHQRHQLLQKVVTERGRMGDGDTVCAG